MTVWTDLQSAIEAEIVSLGYTGTLTEVGIDLPYSAKLITLLDLQSKVGSVINASGESEIVIKGGHTKHVETQLTAPSSTTSRSMDGYSKAYIQVIVANINTNVVLRIEGSNDNTNWANLSALNTDTTITVNGVYAFQYIGAPQHIRTTFVSESGGTAATVDVITRLSA